jgi:hypothetical protein
LPFDGRLFQEAKLRRKIVGRDRSYKPLLASLPAEECALRYLPAGAYRLALHRAIQRDPLAGRRFMATLRDTLQPRHISIDLALQILSHETKGYHAVEEAIASKANLLAEGYADEWRHLVEVQHQELKKDGFLKRSDRAEIIAETCPRPLEAEPSTWRRRLRRDHKYTLAHVSLLLRLVHNGRHGKPILADASTQLDQAAQDRTLAWAEHHELIHAETQQTLDLRSVMESTQAARRGELVSRTKAYQIEGDRRGWIGYLTAETAPSDHHSAPKTGRIDSGWTGITPTQTKRFLQKKAHRASAIVHKAIGKKAREKGEETSRLSPRFGIRAWEPHSDGSTHAHEAGFVDPTFLSDLIRAKVRHFGHWPAFTLQLQRPSHITPQAFRSLVEQLTRDHCPHEVGHPQSMRTLRIIDRVQRLNEDGSPQLDREGAPVRAASWSTYVLKYLVSFDTDDGEGTQLGQVDEFGDEVIHASYGAWARTWEIRRYSTFGVIRNLSRIKVILRQPEPDGGDHSAAAQAWRASRAGDYWTALGRLGHFDSLTPSSEPAPASSPAIGLDEDRVSAHGRPYRTLTAVSVDGQVYHKPKCWTIGRKRSEMADPDAVADRPDCPRSKNKAPTARPKHQPNAPDIPFD